MTLTRVLIILEVWKCLHYKMHHDVDMEDSASMQSA